MSRSLTLLVCCALAPIASASDPLLYSLVGDNPSGFPGFGFAVAGGLDVDGDGVPDMMVGAPYENSFGGQVKVYSGADSSLVMVLQSPDAGHFGSSVAMVGDLNGDQVNDMVVGAPEFTVFGPDPGYAEVRSGADGDLIFHWEGTDNRGQFGSSVADAGDVNNDGVPDIIVGAPLHDGAGTDSGLIRVFSGQDGDLIHTISGASGGDDFGRSVDGIGDVNSDGFDDFVVGAPGAGPGTFRGQVRVFSGQDGSVLFTFTGAADFDQRGWSSAGAGDVNGDGTPDIIYGTPNAFASGSAEVRSGVDGSLIQAIEGHASSSSLGRAVDGAGDVDGDGYGDLIVGDHLASAAFGEVWLISGRDGSTISQVTGGGSNDRLGGAVAGLGDVDGDGFADVIMGADQGPVQAPGFARVYSGKPALVGDVQSLSLASGGTLSMNLSAPTSHGGGLFWVFGSVTGFAPGLTFANGVTLPLNLDAYFDLTLLAPTFFPSFIGTLDGNGDGASALTLPPGLDPILVGLPFRHAFLARNFGQLDFASNPLLLEITP